MISTVTVTTISAVTDATLTDTLALVCVLTLLGLLILKELTRVASGYFALALNWALNVPLVPLLMTFVVIVAARIIEAL